MQVDRNKLIEHFYSLSDAELLLRFHSGSLTDIAQEVALAELKERGLENATVDASNNPAEDDAPLEDLVEAARFFTPTEAHILQGNLQAEGIPAIVADAQFVQTNMLLSFAVGGVRVLVPESLLQRAREIIDAREHGDYKISSDDEDIIEHDIVSNNTNVSSEIALSEIAMPTKSIEPMKFGKSTRPANRFHFFHFFYQDQRQSGPRLLFPKFLRYLTIPSPLVWVLVLIGVFGIGWLYIIRQSDNEIAKFDLGQHYYSNENYGEAAKMWRFAADAGILEAYNNLGYLTYYGLGVKQDRAEGLRLWRIAAENGYSESQIFLSEAYSDRLYFDENIVEAYAWAQVAKYFSYQIGFDDLSKDLHETAVKRLNSLIVKMSKAEIKEAEQKAAFYILKITSNRKSMKYILRYPPNK